MPFVITQQLVEKTFIKVGQELGENLDLNSPQNAIAFLSGLVDSLQKEAHMNPSQALGFLKYLTEVGYSEAKINKTASVEDGKELDIAFEKMQEKIAGCILKDAGIRSAVGEFLRPVFQPSADQAVKNYANNAIGDIGKQIGGFATKAWDQLKSPEFLGKVAPYAIGALGGYLIPKMLGAGGNGLVNAGLGAAAVGGGAYLTKKYDLTNPEAWKGFKDKAMNFVGLGGQPKQASVDSNWNATKDFGEASYPSVLFGRHSDPLSKGSPFGGIGQYNHRGLPTGLVGTPSSQSPFGTGAVGSGSPSPLMNQPSGRIKPEALWA